MSITPTTMKCPACPEFTLETFSASIGNFERCPNCGGLFIHQELVAAASHDKAKCQEALQEIHTLLLPTEKWCPKCLQKLSDGRVRSRGIIFTICSTCQTLWTGLELLGQFEEAIERTLRDQIELARSGPSADRASREHGASYSSSSFRVEERQDSGLGQFFRAFARFFDWWADRFSGHKSRPAPPKVIKPKSKPEMSAKRPLIREVEPAAPAPLPPKVKPAPAAPVRAPIETVRKEPPATQQGGRAPDVWRSEPLSGPPSIDIPEFVFPEEPPATQQGGRASSTQPALPASSVAGPDAWRSEPKPEPIPEPIAEPMPEPEPELEPEASDKREEETNELLRLMGEDSSYFSKPVPKSREEVKKAPELAPAPNLPAAKPPISKPAEKKPAPQTSPAQPGLLAKFKAAWSPTPKKTIKPVISAAPGPAATSKPPAMPVPKPPKPQIPKGPGFLAKLFAPGKPAVKGAAKITTPIPAERPVPAPAAKPSEPQKEAAPVIKKPVPVARKTVPSIKPKREKPPRAPVDHLALWPPWVFALAGVFSSSFRDFGFEGLPAVLWGLAGWALGVMVRLGRLYPFKPFEECSLNDLAVLNGPNGPRARPVILLGQLVPLDELNPKSALIFKQADKTLVINRLGRWDILPRLFGISNPRQLPKGDVTIRGWYHPGPDPSLEVHDLRAGKITRKSMVRSLRWAFSVSLFLLSVVIYLALD